MGDYIVRDGKQVAPTCPICGCRLEKKKYGGYSHYNSQPFGWYNYVDAQNHKCKYTLHSMEVFERKVMVNVSTNYMDHVWIDPTLDTDPWG